MSGSFRREDEARYPSPGAIVIIGEGRPAKVAGLDANLVFPSRTAGPNGEVQAQSAMVRTLQGRMGRATFTVHGFRSSFCDWCSEHARAEREVAEAALSHATGNEVERAYARSDRFNRRRALMDEWRRFCLGELPHG